MNKDSKAYTKWLSTRQGKNRSMGCWVGIGAIAKWIWNSCWRVSSDGGFMVQCQKSQSTQEHVLWRQQEVNRTQCNRETRSPKYNRNYNSNQSLNQHKKLKCWTKPKFEHDILHLMTKRELKKIHSYCFLSSLSSTFFSLRIK